MGIDGKKLTLVREEKGYSRQVLANKLGVHVTTIHSYESGRLVPRSATVKKIADVLEINISDILKTNSTLPESYSKTCLKYTNMTLKELEDDESIWHSDIENFYKEMNYLGQTIKSLLHSMPSIFYIKDKQLKYVIANNAFYKNLGKTGVAIEGKTDFEVLSRRKAKINHYRDLDVLKNEKILKLKDTIPLNQKNKLGIITKTPLYDENQLLIGVLCTITDVTSLEEQKKENLELKAAKNALFAMHDNSPDSVWIMDGNKVIYANPSAKKLYGLDIANSKIFPFLLPKAKITDFSVNINGIIHNIQDVIIDFKNDINKTSLNFDHEYKIDKDSDVYVYKSLYQLNRIDNYIQISCTTRNITNEIKIQKDKQLLLDIIEKLPEAISVVSNYGKKLVIVSSSIQHITGLSLQTLHNTRCNEELLNLVHKDDKDRVLKYRDYLDSEEWWNDKDENSMFKTIKYRIVKDNHIKWVEASNYSTIQLKNQGIRFSVLRDITEQKIVRNIKLLHKVINSLPNIVWIATVEPEFKYYFISDAIKEFSGISKHEFLKNPKLWPSLRHPDDVGAFEQWHKYKQCPSYYRYRIIRPDKQIRKIEEIFFKGTDFEGREIYYGILRDIT